MRKYVSISVIEARDPDRAARIRLREREKRRRHRASNPDKARLDHKRDHARREERRIELGLPPRVKSPERSKADKRKYIENSRPKYWVSHYRGRAKGLGVPFDLDEDWFAKRLAVGRCELSDIVFDFTQRRGPNSATVDRIKAGGGYTKDNCRLILWSINRALSNWGEEYLFDVFRRVLEKRSV